MKVDSKHGKTHINECRQPNIHLFAVCLAVVKSSHRKIGTNT